MRIVDQERTVETVPGFCDRVARESGQPVEACYQCGKCTAGCPLVRAMDMAPSQVIRAVQLGLKDLALDAGAVWLCAGCETCASRCPRDIDMSRVMKTLARIALQEGRKPKEAAVANFHKSFLESMGRWGRAHELEVVSLTKARTPQQMLKDIGLGAALFGHGRLALFPHRVPQAKQVRDIMAKSKETRDEG